MLNQSYIDKNESVIDRRSNIYFPIIITAKYINLFENDKSNNLLHKKRKMVVKSTIIPSKERIISKIEPILKYYSENGYIVNIKNHLEKEISLDELIEQYFDNVNDYFEELEDNNNSVSSSTTTEAWELEQELEKKLYKFCKDGSPEEYLLMVKIYINYKNYYNIIKILF